jgi:hypothetical protein
MGALRLIFVQEAGTLQLVAARAVDMVVPRSHPIRSRPTGAPFWVELQSADGTVLYRRLMPHPFPHAFEIPTGDRDAPFQRREAPPYEEEATSARHSLRRVFSVVVPDVEGGRIVELLGTPGGDLVDTSSFGRFEVPDARGPWTTPGVGP